MKTNLAQEARTQKHFLDPETIDGIALLCPDAVEGVRKRVLGSSPPAAFEARAQ